jgi:hypothetical protein
MCGVKLPHTYINNKEITLMKKLINNTVNTVAITLWAWIGLSTLQGMLHIGTITNINFWQLVINLIK